MKIIIFLILSFSLLYGEDGLKATKIHKVVSGDTLWDIALKYYGDGFKWGKVYNGNMDLIKNPDLIFPNMELKIPEIEENIIPQIPEEKTDKLNVSSISLNSIQSSTFSVESSTNSVEVSTTSFNNILEGEIKLDNINTQEAKKEKIEYIDGLTLNEEMPESQITSPIMTKTVKVSEDFFDGVVLEKKSEDEIEKEGIAKEGDIVIVEFYKNNVEVGQNLVLYKKGVYIDDKITAQYAGIARVLNKFESKKAECEVLKIYTAIDENVFVKIVRK